MRQHRRIHRIQLRLVQIGLEDALLEIVEDDIAHRSAKHPERLLVQSRPSVLVRLPHHFAERLARVLQRHHEQLRPAVLAVRVARERALAEVHLRLFPGGALQHVEALGLARLQAANEALHRVVPGVKPWLSTRSW